MAKLLAAHKTRRYIYMYMQLIRDAGNEVTSFITVVLRSLKENQGIYETGYWLLV